LKYELCGDYFCSKKLEYPSMRIEEDTMTQEKELIVDPTNGTLTENVWIRAMSEDGSELKKINGVVSVCGDQTKPKKMYDRGSLKMPKSNIDRFIDVDSLLS